MIGRARERGREREGGREGGRGGEREREIRVCLIRTSTAIDTNLNLINNC